MKWWNEETVWIINCWVMRDRNDWVGVWTNDVIIKFAQIHKLIIRSPMNCSKWTRRRHGKTLEKCGYLRPLDHSRHPMVGVHDPLWSRIAQLSIIESDRRHNKQKLADNFRSFFLFKFKFKFQCFCLLTSSFDLSAIVRIGPQLFSYSLKLCNKMHLFCIFPL